MVKFEFEEFIAALRFSYEMRMPTEDVMDFWFAKVKHIPSEALEYCLDTIKRDNPNQFPKHFQDKLSAVYYDWRRKQSTTDEESGCANCDHGFVETSQYEPMYDRDITTLAGCHICNGTLASKRWLDAEKKTCRIIMSNELS